MADGGNMQFASDGLLRPQTSAPVGVELNNMRRRGVDALNIKLTSPKSAGRPLLVWPIAGLLGLVLGGVLIGLLGVSISVTIQYFIAGLAIVAIAAIGLGRPSRPMTWSVNISPNLVAISGNIDAASVHTTKNLAFWDIEQLSVEMDRFGGTGKLVVTTKHETLTIGNGLPEVALVWLKNLLTLEIAGLSWRPLYSVDRNRSVSRNERAYNPLLLRMDLALRIYEMFMNEAPGIVRKLGAAVAGKDHEAARQHAHWLKSACASVGGQQLSDLCQLLQIRAAGEDLERADSIVAEINIEFEKVMARLAGIRAAASEIDDDATIGAEPERSEVATLDCAADAVSSATSEQPQSSELLDVSVLVVDDSSVGQEIAKEFLSGIVRHVDVARDGHEALQKWKEGDFALILMDCEMLGMDGFECAKQIRRSESLNNSHRIPVIAVTAHALKRDQERCIAAGMDDYLSKPYAEEELAEKVRGWLLRSASNEASEPAPEIPIMPKFELRAAGHKKKARKAS